MQEHSQARTAPRLSLDRASRVELSQLKPWLSATHIALTWAAVIGAGAACWALRDALPLVSWLALYLLTVAFIGARQHDLLMVFMHEGAHKRLWRSRPLNDAFTEAVLAWPFILVSMRAYRVNHLAHHLNLNTHDDPDWRRKASWIYPRTPLAFARLLGLYLFGLGFARFLMALRHIIRRPETRVDWAWVVAKAVFVIAMLAVIAGSGLLLPWILFWVVPFATWFQLVFNLRSMADHSDIHGREGGFAKTRNITLGPLSWLFVMSGGRAFYHHEHHLHETIPYYHLGRAHARLMADPAYARQIHVTHGLTGFIQECMEAELGGREIEAADMDPNPA